MKSNKIWIAVLCIAMITIALSSPAVANPNGNLNEPTVFKISAPGDTLHLTQNEYLTSTENAISQSTNDDQKIESICETFLTLAKASVRDPQSYDCTQLIAADSLKKATVQYRLTDYEYQSALNKALGWKILSDNLDFTDFMVQKKGEDSAVASVVESYTYYITNGFNDESFRRKKYTFELLRGAEGWKITNVTTDDPWETEPNFKYGPIDVKSAVNAHLAENNKIKSSTPLINETKGIKSAQISPSTSMYLWSYNTSKAVSYAVAHFKDTQNSVFGYDSRNNCQNFASQCVWAGLGGSGSDKTVRPAVPTSLVGTSAFNVWCAGQSTTYYTNNYNLNWPWNNVQGFAQLIYASTSSTEGPYGYTWYNDGVQTANVGDVLTVNWQGAPSRDTLDHAMFVTGVTGTAGSRTKDDVKIAAHTSATNTAYDVLSVYTPASIGCFGKDTVVCGYYSVPQP